MNLLSSVPSALWVVGTQGSTIFLRLISTIVLTRLLFPEAFGTMLIIGTITSLIMLVSDVGLRGSIINNARTDHDKDYVNTIWTLQVIRGAVIAIIIFASSFLAAKLYKNIDSLSFYLQLTSLSALILGFRSTRLNEMERRMQMMRPALVQIATRCVALITTIWIAGIYPTALSIVLGEIIAAAAFVIMSHVSLIGTRNSFCLDRESLPGIFRYGRWILVSTLLTWCVREGHKFFFGIVLSVQILGFYAIASNIANVSKGILTNFADRWVFPMYVKLGEAGGLDVSALKIRAIIVFIGSIAVTLLVILAELIVGLLYEDTYADVSPFIKIIAIGSIGAIVTDCYVPVYKAKADSFGLMKNRAMQACMLGIFAYTGYVSKGAEGIVLGSCFAQLVAGPVTAFMARKHFERKILLLDSLIYTLPFIAFYVYHFDVLTMVFQNE